MDDQLIEFHAIEKDWIPAPYPAVKNLPDWYKTLARDVELPGVRGTLHTLKQCPPFLDAMSIGYIIPLSGDANFEMDNAGQLKFDCPNGDASIELHHPAQVAGSPWGQRSVIKFMNPWIIVTPPGYSTLFVPPMNHQEISFHVLAGVVDTDRFYSQINFPAVCLMERGTKCTLKRGTPLMQVIPFKRETWRHEIGHADAQRVAASVRSISHSHHVYREQAWQRKSFE
jgi:hypothetical protein